jgi:hypothetical protein
MDGLNQHPGRIDWNIRPADVFDPSVLTLLASNAVVIVWARVEGWPLAFVMCVYATQSIIIGFFWFFTILTYGTVYEKRLLDGYEHYSILDSGERATAASIFAFHYAAFHFVYLLFIVGIFVRPMFNTITDTAGGAEYRMSEFPFITLIIIAGIFFFDRLVTFLRERRENAGKQANIANLMFYPYARIVPMHAATILGASLEEGNLTGKSALLLFLLLKTGADVFMHIVQKKGFASDTKRPRIDDSAPRVAGTPDGPALVMPDGRIIPLTDRPDIVEKLQRIRQFPSDVRLEVCRKLLRLDDPPPKKTPQLRCRCEKTDFIEGEAAQKYVDGHLEWLETAESGSSRYICPDTKKTWVMVAGVLKAEHPEADKVLCRCREIECLQGPDAHHYAKEHLKAVETDGGWRTTYICPYTDKRWLLDFTKIADVDQYKYARLRPMPLKENNPGRTRIQDG